MFTQFPNAYAFYSLLALALEPVLHQKEGKQYKKREYFRNIFLFFFLKMLQKWLWGQRFFGVGLFFCAKRFGVRSLATALKQSSMKKSGRKRPHSKALRAKPFKNKQNNLKLRWGIL